MPNEEHPDLPEARARMSGVANGLVRKLGPMHASSVLIGAGLGILLQHLGDGGTRRYFEALLDEHLRQGQPPLN